MRLSYNRLCRCNTIFGLNYLRFNCLGSKFLKENIFLAPFEYKLVQTARCLSSQAGPCLVCFLDISEKVAMKRADFGGERYEMTAFQRKVRMNSDKLRDPSWLTVSADGTLDEVQEELYKVRYDFWDFHLT